MSSLLHLCSDASYSEVMRCLTPREYDMAGSRLNPAETNILGNPRLHHASSSLWVSPQIPWSDIPKSSSAGHQNDAFTANALKLRRRMREGPVALQTPSSSCWQ